MYHRNHLKSYPKLYRSPKKVSFIIIHSTPEETEFSGDQQAAKVLTDGDKKGEDFNPNLLLFNATFYW